MLENLDEMTNDDNGYQVFITGISWNKNSNSRFASKKDFSKNLPDQFTFSLPDNIVSKKNFTDFNDIVESFVYNFLTRRFNHEVYKCQIWLPLDK